MARTLTCNNATETSRNAILTGNPAGRVVSDPSVEEE
jgi:hypothetical protein